MGDRWYLVDLAADQVPGHHLVSGPDRRRALASFRADMVLHFRMGASKAWAVDAVRAKRPVVISGPLTAETAREHATGWEWAWAISRLNAFRSISGEPAAPADRATAVRFLGTVKADDIAEAVAKQMPDDDPVQDDGREVPDRGR